MSSNPAYKYTEAFVLMCKGHPVEDVAEATHIPVEVLKQHASAQGWVGLHASLRGHFDTPAQVPAKTGWALAILDENRETNYKQAAQLRGLAQNIIDTALQYRAQNPEAVMTSKALRDLACALATIHDLTYRAIGDVIGKKDGGPDKPAGATIHVHLPSVLAEPRPLGRTLEIAAKAEEA